RTDWAEWVGTTCSKRASPFIIAWIFVHTFVIKSYRKLIYLQRLLCFHYFDCDAQALPQPPGTFRVRRPRAGAKSVSGKSWTGPSPSDRPEWWAVSGSGRRRMVPDFWPYEGRSREVPRGAPPPALQFHHR